MEKRKVQSSGANLFHFFQQPGSRYYSVRFMVDGQRRRFSTGETNLKAAHSKAAAIMADIKSRGLESAPKLHGKRRDEIPADPTVQEFCKLYRNAIITADSPPSKETSERYLRCLTCHRQSPLKSMSLSCRNGSTLGARGLPRVAGRSISRRASNVNM